MTETTEELVTKLVEKAEDAFDLIYLNAAPAMQTLAGQAANLSALGPVAADIEVTADNITAIQAASGHAADAIQAKLDAVAAQTAAEAAAASAGGDPLDALARARFGMEFPGIQHPAKVLDFRSGHGLGDLTFARSTPAYLTDHRRMIVPASADVPRLQHDPATGAPEGLAIAPARTRLLDYSVNFTAWNSSSTVETADDAPSPDGGNTATRIQDNHTSAPGGTYRLTSIADDTSHYISSVYVLKAPDNPCCGMQAQIYGTGGHKVWVDLDPGTGESYSANGVDGTDFGVVDAGRWWRLWIRVQNNGTGLDQAYTHIFPVTKPSGSVTGPGVGTLTGFNHFWGAQFERSDVLSSVILGAEGSQVTVDGDEAAIDLTTAEWFSNVAGAGTFLFDLTLDWAQQNAGVMQLRTDSGAYANWRNTAGGDCLGSAAGVRRGNDGDFRFSGTAWSGDHHRKVRTMGNHRAVIAWDQVGFTVGLDGDAPDSMAWNAPPEAFTELQIGNVGGQPTMAGRFGRIAYWPRKLSDAEIQTITGA